MKLTLLLAVLFVCYGVAAGNFLWEIVKGVSEGIQDAEKDGEQGKLKSWKEKLEKRIAGHPKFKDHKGDLKKSIIKAGKGLNKLQKKLLKKYDADKSKIAEEKHLKAVNKWISTLTKNDTDGEVEHGIPFLPRVVLHKKEASYEEDREKALNLFNNLAKMWAEKIIGHPDESEQKETKAEIKQEKEKILGSDEEKIIPDFVKEDFKKQNGLLGRKEIIIQPKFVSEELKHLHKDDKMEEEENPTQPTLVDDEVKDLKEKEKLAFEEEKSNPKMIGAAEMAIELLGLTGKEKEEKVKDEVKMLKVVNKESDDLEKTVEVLLPFLGEGKVSKEKQAEAKKGGPNVEGKVNKGLKVINVNPSYEKTMEEVKGEEDKSKTDEEEEEIMSTKEKFLEFKKKEMEIAEKKIAQEQKMFEEAEKKWILEVQKKAREEFRKAEEKKKMTTEEKEVEEELKESKDDVFTPPNEVMTTAEPEIKREDKKPIIYFDFDESEDEQKPEDKEPAKEEKLFQVPLVVKEPAEILNHKKDSFLEMPPEIKPFLQKLDDPIFRNKFLVEEKQWMQLKKWAVKKLFKGNKKQMESN